MNQEIEIKIKISNPDEIEKKILEKGRFIKERKQTDKYFVPQNQDWFEIKPVSKYLRIRYEDDKHHLNYTDAKYDNKTVLLTSDEYEFNIEDPKTAEEFLKQLGHELKVTVTKTRKYFQVENFEIVLDNIKELGNFIEIEAKKDFGNAKKTRQACFDFAKELGIQLNQSEYKSSGYPNMILENQKL